MPARDTAALIAALPDPDVRVLAGSGRIQGFRKDAVFIQEGELGDSIYILLAGRVQVFAADDEDRRIVLAVYGPGETLGEMALDGGPRSASAVALEPVTVAVVTRVALLDHIRANPEFALTLLAKVIRRARRATASTKNLALLDVYGRVVKLFNELAVEEAGVRRIPERLTHQAIAAHVGASREMISRLLKDLANGGYIAIEDHHIVLKRTLPASW